MSDIFISYDHSDRLKAQALVEAFEQQGWSVWWDPEILPGRPFYEVIEKALNAAKCVVVLWSKASLKSHWVKEEVIEGAERRILVPVLVEDVSIPFGFRQIQTARLVDWQGTSPHSEFDRLLKAVADMLGTSISPEISEIPPSRVEPPKKRLEPVESVTLPIQKKQRDEAKSKIGLYYVGQHKERLNILNKQISYENCYLANLLDDIGISDLHTLSEETFITYLRGHRTDIALIIVDLVLTSEDSTNLEEIKNWSARRLRTEALPKFESQKIVEYIRDFRIETDQKYGIIDFPRILVLLPQNLPDGLEVIGARIKADWWAMWGSEGLEFFDYETLNEFLTELYGDWLERNIPNLTLDMEDPNQ